MDNESAKSYAGATAFVLWALFIFVVIGGGIWLFRTTNADFIGAGNAEIEIQSAGSRIPAYNHFFDLCAAVQTDEAAIDAQIDALAAAETSDDRSRINTNIAALKTNRLRSVQQYNADARKEYTIGQFRDSGLPYQLADTIYDEKGDAKTSCVN